MRESLSFAALPQLECGTYRYADDYRVPFPGVEHRRGRADYVISPLGRVYRDDGALLRPVKNTLKVGLRDGTVCRSVPLAVYRAFGTIAKPPRHSLWVPPDTPIDSETGCRSCSVEHVVFVLHGDLVYLGRGGRRIEDIKTFKIREDIP